MTEKQRASEALIEAIEAAKTATRNLKSIPHTETIRRHLDDALEAAHLADEVEWSRTSFRKIYSALSDIERKIGDLGDRLSSLDAGGEAA
ncbi:hypothetical protein SAMN06297251_10431 [Fulvimarina manganoxydans]|uniref:Uncharacterized protein n=1 Tax=Fulvimarina manganoxydans TaxID=937218 RepID=A0A1W2A8D7_9HYPH|nr:hypothetical protein [Fulvimarina manganoxydans]SMC56975.1 hypothetical protein SAMN06297251_10431 [Fulvimarina manganoxydans]